MASQFAAPPINPLISIQPLTTPAPGRDATSVPAQLTNTPPGTVIEGFVVNRDGQNNPVLRTSLGDLLVKSDVFIKTGSEVIFRVDATQASHARILTIDGLPPQDYAALHARGLTRDTISTTTLPGTFASSAAPMPAGSAAGPGARMALAAAPLQASLVNNAPPAPALLSANPAFAAQLASAASLPAGLAKLQQGAQLRLAIVHVVLPATLPAAPSAPAQAASSPPAFSPAAGPAIASRQPHAASPSAPSSFPPLPDSVQSAPPAAPARMTALAAETLTRVPMAPAKPAAGAPPVAVGTPPAAPTIPPPLSSPSPPLTPQSAAAVGVVVDMPALVIGQEKNGAMIVQTQLGTLKMHAPQPLPVGSQLQLQVQPAPATVSPPPEASPLREALLPITSMAQHWPGLEETLQWAQVNDPALARMIMQPIPDIGPKLVSGLLFFIAAVKGGELRQWLGLRATAALESAAPQLAARLKQDMVQLQQLFVDSPLQQWNSLMVPVLYHGQIEHARLFFRQDQDSGGGQQQGKGGKEQRFVVEVDLSHLGEMQFDGFVRGAARDKQFDLIVRSARPLDVALSQQIRDSFDTAVQTTGMKGYLGFQHGAQHFVRPMARREEDGGDHGAQPILA